ncbi:lysozyme inhibitor LprI family protein [Caproicibacter sp.]|uniref:lysozyme inhibitor LprI family protein n=1 Tax=Caproicibacter sp. TaxID=2814884 RepID=UPI003988BB6C
MKRNFPATILAAALALTLLLPGCSLTHQSPAASSESSSSQSLSSQPASSQDDPSSDGGSSDPGEPPADSEPGRVLTITTDNEKFNQKFSENPVDKAYIKESDQAVSTVDMVNVSQKYAGLWQKEIDHAWSELSQEMSSDSSGKPAELKAEQKKWEDEKDAKLKKIVSDALSGGGSMAEVNAASQEMDFYRSRAAQLYRELYDYDKNYSYAYLAK